MKLALSGRDQRMLLLVVGLGLFTVWAYGTYIAGPLMREASNLSQEVRTLRDQLKTLAVATSNETALREQQQQLNQTVESLRRLLPSEEEIPTVIAHLSGLASQTGVKIQAIFPERSAEALPAIGSMSQKSGNAPPAPVVYKEIPIQIDALAGYHQLGAFLNWVESSEKPMQISTLRISGNQKEMKRHLVRLQLRSYFAVNDEVAGRGASTVPKAPDKL